MNSILAASFLLAGPLLAASGAGSSANPLDLDFNDDVDRWRIVVDGVMGGLSTGRVAQPEPGVLRFSGNLSLENNGGFSQMRRAVSGDQFADADGIEITVRGDGRVYTFDIRCSNVRLMAGAFQREFLADSGDWQTLRIPFEAFTLYNFGRRVEDAPALRPTLTESIGVTLGDKTAGPFQMEIASIRTYGNDDTASEGADSAGADSEGADVSTASAGATRLIEMAINRGAPLFNDGQHAACAAIYEMTMASLVALGDDLDAEVIRRLERGLADAERDHTWTDRAWTYREAMDEAYAHLARRMRTARMSASP